MPQDDSGLDELKALSRKFNKQKEDNEKQARQKAEQGKKVQGVLHGLQDLNFNMALTQLKAVAKPEVIQKVTALRTNPGTADLRKLITTMVDDLETQLGKINGAKPDLTPLTNSIRTVSILLDLYFSTH
jgi:hypothetical protein